MLSHIMICIILSAYFFCLQEHSIKIQVVNERLKSFRFEGQIYFYPSLKKALADCWAVSAFIMSTSLDDKM